MYYIFLWETPIGNRCWDVVQHDNVHEFISKICHEDVNPSTLIVCNSAGTIKWLVPSCHNGQKEVDFCKINSEISGRPFSDRRTTPFITGKTVKGDIPPEYGWLAPDGRIFPCEYFGHQSKARDIVGAIEEITDPEQHLENLGWARIGKGMRSQFRIGMGKNQKLTDKQLEYLSKHHQDNVEDIALWV